MNKYLSTLETIAVVIAIAFASRMMILTPILVGPWMKVHGIDAQQVGYVIAAEYVGMAIIMVLAPLWITRISFKWAAIASFALLFITDYLSFISSSYYELLSFRAISGIGYGIIGASGTVLLGKAKKPDFAYGAFVSLSFLTGAVGFFALPAAMELYGIESVKWGLFLPVLVGFITALFIPHTPPDNESDAVDSPHTSETQVVWSRNAILVLASAAAIYITLMGLWTYIEQIGSTAGQSLQSIGNTLAVAQLITIFTALSATSFRKLLGNTGSILAVGALFVGSVFTLFYAEVTYAFFAALIIFNIGWSIAPTILFGILTEITNHSKIIAIYPLMQTLGLILGPATMASLVVGTDFDGVILASLLLACISTALALLACRKAVTPAVGPATAI